MTILAPAFVADASGGKIQSPATAVTHATRWGNLRTLSGSERFRFQQLSAEANHVIELREYLGTVTVRMEAMIGSRIFQIEHVAHDEQRHEWTDLYVRENL